MFCSLIPPPQWEGVSRRVAIVSQPDHADSLLTGHHKGTATTEVVCHVRLTEENQGEYTPNATHKTYDTKITE